MPAKAPIDENVKFLFACLIRSDYKTIDFTRVAADFSINPAAARMRWSRLKKTINVDDIASSILDGKKKRMSKPRSSPPCSVKVEIVENDTLEPPPAASAVGITFKVEEEVPPEGLAPVLFAGLPKPPNPKRARAEEQVAIPVVDEAAGAVGRFAATRVPHLPRVAEATAIADPETKPQPRTPQKTPPEEVVQASLTLKSEPKARFEEEEKAMKCEPLPTDTIRENAGNAVMVLKSNGSKKRKVESM
ncbi:unnamed protein product [Tuber aestivum]|uniref:Myb-like DNA-binding domain-containing protein n=1 Tax=Tuber aestivum TaxID=59557 RepID=A0A292Q7I2_9PEZI|nr:unnamed protein product [Tuber aestivum]